MSAAMTVGLPAGVALGAAIGTIVSRIGRAFGPEGRRRADTLGLFVGAAIALAASVFLTLQLEKPSWRSFSAKDGAFSVSFPGVPEEKSEDRDTPGGRVRGRTYECRPLFSNANYVVIVLDYPESTRLAADDVYEKFKTAHATRLNGVVLHEAAASAGEVKGKHWKIGAPHARLVFMRCFVVKERLYALSANVPDDTFVEETVVPFLESFRVTPGS